jgi:hypothetical protein
MLQINWIIVLSYLLASTLGLSPFGKKMLTTENGAMCMDGSPYGIYVFEPDGTPANKLMIFWEDIPDAWCFGSSSSSSV